MADINIHVTSVIEAYQRRLNSKPYVPSTTFGGATLGTNANARMVTDEMSEDEICYRMLCFRVNQARFMFLQSNLNIMEILHITYDIVRIVAANTIQQKHICSVAACNR